MQPAFIPFDETEDPDYKKWEGEDKTDKAIPEIKGFISDFVYATRGREVASLYAIWSSIFLVSSLLQRDTWFTPPNGDEWFDKEYLNMYVLLIGPAGCGKSSALNIVQKLLAAAMKELKESPDAVLKRKDMATISNMATPEAFLSTLYQHSRGEENIRRSIPSVDKKGKMTSIKAISNGVGVISEFGSLLGKQNYQQGMSTILLDLYDTPAAYRWNTVKRGHVMLPEVYFNLIGATTADSIGGNVNPAILQDGFMSRTIMVNVEGFPRKREFRFKTGCSMSDLARRLLWITATQRGNFVLSKDAEKYYGHWYKKFMKRMNERPEEAGYMIRNRSLALKVAAIMKMTDYLPGKVIQKKHLEAAFKLIDYTYAQVADLINYFSNAQLGASKNIIVKVIEEQNAGRTRRELAQIIKKYNSEVVDQALVDLWLEGSIIVVDSKGDTEYGTRPQGFPRERYAIVRKKFKGRAKDFKIERPEQIPTGDEEYVLERYPGSDDSKDTKKEPVGDISSPQRVWG